MSDNLKNDILKAVEDSKAFTNSTSSNSTEASMIFKDPQMLQHSLDKSLRAPQRLAESADKIKNNN